MEMPEIINILEDGGTDIAHTRMCRFGMDSYIKGKNGERGLVKKPTGFMTSS